MDDFTRVVIGGIFVGCVQSEVAEDYAAAITAESAGIASPDWPMIDAAILAKWKPSGLALIKKLAWKHTTKRESP